jgi:hypothetical protein
MKRISDEAVIFSGIILVLYLLLTSLLNLIIGMRVTEGPAMSSYFLQGTVIILIYLVSIILFVIGLLKREKGFAFSIIAFAIVALYGASMMIILLRGNSAKKQ